MGDKPPHFTGLSTVYSRTKSGWQRRHHSALWIFCAGMYLSQKPGNAENVFILGRLCDNNFLWFQDIDTIDDQLRAQIQFWMMQTANVVATIIIICYSTPIFVAVLIPLVILFAFMQVCITTMTMIPCEPCDILNRRKLDSLTPWGRDKMVATYLTTFLNAFSCMKIYKFRLRFHWSFFPRV